MIERCRTVAGDAVDALSADWNDLRENRFDLIFAALVLQHIEPGSVPDFTSRTSCGWRLPSTC